MIRSVKRHFSSLSRIGVIGAGQMGSGIAQVSAAKAGRGTVLIDKNEAQLDKAEKFITKLLEKDVAKGRLTLEQKGQALSLLSFSSQLESASDCNFVIEAVSENLALKTSIFQQLDQILPPSAILASNTSSISITKLAAVTSRPQQFIGMHFMNPVPVMSLVEVIQGLETTASTLDQTCALAQEMGKTTTSAQDVPGFIANRLLMPYINEAVFALAEGVATKEDIDKTMKLGTNVPMGPLLLADFIGLDTCLAIMRVLHEGLGEDKYRPAPLLVKYVDAGRLGKKSGHGFYSYNN